MLKIFISYRRDDSAYATGVIRDQLAAQLNGCEIFLDVDSIPYGVNFREHIEQSVSACDCLVAVIGKTWLTVADREGKPRLETPGDAVRIEIEAALRRGIPLIPVILDNTHVPSAGQLPESMRELSYRNAIFVRPPPDFNHDVQKLVATFQDRLAQTAGGSSQSPGSVAPIQSSRLSHASPARKTGRWAVLLAILAIAAGVLGVWHFTRPSGPPVYKFGDTYLYADSDSNPMPTEPHSRMKDGGFFLPLNFVHLVLEITYPPDLRPASIPLKARLLDSNSVVVEFNGLSGELPDSKYPESGKTQWIATFGSVRPLWKPGKYTIELSSPTQSTNIPFEVFAH